MNNKDFIHQLSLRLGITHEEAQATMNKTIDIMGDVFQEGDSIQMPNFGTFEVKKRLERIVVNQAQNKGCSFRLNSCWDSNPLLL